MESDSNYEPEPEDIVNEEINKDEDYLSKKPHKCKYPGCTAAFARPYRLKQHLMVHGNKVNTDCTHSIFFTLLHCYHIAYS